MHRLGGQKDRVIKKTKLQTRQIERKKDKRERQE